MALEIKQTFRLSQQLVITPQLQQAIKLLQLSRFELQNLVQHELLENPVLEETEENTIEKEESTTPETHDSHDKEQRLSEVGTKEGDLKEPTNFDWENYLGTYNAPESGTTLGPRSSSDELPSYENRASATLSLRDHLIWQLHMSEMSEQELEIARELVSGINEEGYFKGDVEEIAKSRGVSSELVVEILQEVQQFDPPGVGARNLQECLKIQIRPFTKEAPLLEKLIDHHLEDLEKRNYGAISKNLGVSKEKLKELAHLLSTLEPKPGRPFGGENPQYIVPDVFINKVGDEYLVFLNDDGLPKLQVSSFYRNALSQNGKTQQDGAKDFIQEKLRSAMWLIRSIHQRQRTLYRVTKSIVKFQKEFLEHGVMHLKPMILRDVAQDIEMHESTISRVTTNKFVQTPRGLFELKFFFNNRVATSSGTGITSESVKDSIRRMIQEENARHPLSDQQIAEKLKEGDVSISRRTVAKYRELIGLGPSSRRRQVL